MATGPVMRGGGHRPAQAAGQTHTGNDLLRTKEILEARKGVETKSLKEKRRKVCDHSIW